MTRQLFIYYRIPKADIALGMRCAYALLNSIAKAKLGTGELFQREEADKPYFTLMEVLTPEPTGADDIERFMELVNKLAETSFSALPTPPARHVEVFSKVSDQGAQ